tara:strand:- start:9620 stop:9838 length:219 start_codon:yes stop_codon:yes gene_type:complete
MSSNPKRRAHVWYSMNSKKELVMKNKNEEYEPLNIMNILCAIGFFIALALVVTGLAFALEGVLCALGVISDC